MQRRQFLATCASLGGAAAIPGDAASLAAMAATLAQTPPQFYTRARLVDVHGAPLRARDLLPETNYVFHYPFAATPCLLLKLARPLIAPAAVVRGDGVPYMWPGGVGRENNIVAFSAICAHKLAYPTREVSFIKYQRDSSATSAAHVIHCCADHSVYDPAQGARVVSGPAPQPLAAIVLDYAADADALDALGTVGAEQFPAFFNKYRVKLELEYGPRQAQRTIAGAAVVRELANFCKTTIAC